MLFNSYAFIFGFLPVVLVGFFVAGRTSGRYAACAWLAAASLFFYAWWQPVFLLLLVASILGNAVLGRYLVTAPARWKRWGLVGGVVLSLALLGYFKYAGFLVFNMNHLLSTRFAVPHIVLPIGLSFFTFQQIAYLSDSTEGRVRDYNLVNYTLFVTFFPHLIAGPIVHHREMMPQFSQPSVIRLEPSNLVLGLSIFTIGLFKKTVLADVTATWADPTFNAAATGVVPDPAQAWVAALAFTFQLYFDFSGYSDMAIGLARMFNIVLPLNFYSPYKAVNIIDFWRRWHMTLSRFLRDYLYFPLGGNRKGALRRYGNLLATMTLGGVWHGAAWTFIVWGTLHGVMLMANHAWHTVRRAVGLAPRSDSRAARIAATALTFFFVVCAWVFFRAADLPTASTMLRSMFGLNGARPPRGRGPTRSLARPPRLHRLRRPEHLSALRTLRPGARRTAVRARTPSPSFAVARVAGLGHGARVDVRRLAAAAPQDQPLPVLPVLTVSSLRFFAAFAVAAVTAAALIIGVNAVIDPMGVVPVSPSLCGVNAEKVMRFNNDRIYKPLDLFSVRPRTVVLGTSRILQAFDPATLAGTPYAPAYNYGFAGGELNELEGHFENFIARTPSVKHVFVELFLPAPRRKQPTPNAPELLAATFLSWSALLQSAETVWQNALLVRARRAIAGPIVRADGRQSFVDVSPVPNFLAYPRALLRTPPRYELNPWILGSMRRMRHLARDKRIALTFSISPVHAVQLYTLYVTGHWPVLEQWKRELAREFEVLDFSTYTQITEESVEE